MLKSFILSDNMYSNSIYCRLLLRAYFDTNNRKLSTTCTGEKLSRFHNDVNWKQRFESQWLTLIICYGIWFWNTLIAVRSTEIITVCKVHPPHNCTAISIAFTTECLTTVGLCKLKQSSLLLQDSPTTFMRIIKFTWNRQITNDLFT